MLKTLVVSLMFGASLSARAGVAPLTVAVHFAAEGIVRRYGPSALFRPVELISIVPVPTALGMVRGPDLTLSVTYSGKELLIGQIYTTVAGPVAQRLRLGRVEAVGHDFAQAREYVGRLSRKDATVDRVVFMQDAVARVTRILREHEDEHTALVQALLQELTLSGERMQAVLTQARSN